MPTDTVVAFDAGLGADATTDAEVVIRTGKIFEIGDYPDKNFAFDEGDLDHAIAVFTPVAVDLEHIPTVLQNKMGQVRRIFRGSDGKSVMGEVALPVWLDKVLEGTDRAVSAAWDRSTKTLQNLSLVRNPRVSDAALFAAFSMSSGDASVRFDKSYDEIAQDVLRKLRDQTPIAGGNNWDDDNWTYVRDNFPGYIILTKSVDNLCSYWKVAYTRDATSGEIVIGDVSQVEQAFVPAAEFARKRHDTPSGQMAIQRLHDMAVSSGAVCSQPATMASRHESSAMQKIHDTAVEHGATCSAVGSNPTYFSDAPASPPKTPTPHRRSRMNVLDWIKGKATEEGVEIDDLEAAFSNDGSLSQEVKTALAAKDAEIAALKAGQEQAAVNFAKLADERRQAEAVTFANGFVAAKRVPPVAALKLAPLAARIAAADSTVTFADGEQSTSALLQEFCEALPDLSIFTTEHIAPNTVAALFNATETEGVSKPKEPTQDRIDALLKTTASGRAVLAERSKSNGH